MLLTMWLLMFQDLDLDRRVSWEDLARPWMTQEESRLYDQLSESERSLFQGYFLERRLDDPQSWTETGRFLPGFHGPKPHGDIRDQILFALGAPRDTQSQALNPQLPASWSYDSLQLHFEARPGGKVALARESLESWDKIKGNMVRHPELRYDFGVRNFGRTRLPDDVRFSSVELASSYQRPQAEGSLLRLSFHIPDSFKEHVRQSKANPLQHMELLVNLMRPGQMEVASDEGHVRHGSVRVNLLEENFLSFDVFVPAGYYQAHLQIYSGFLRHGLETRENLSVLPSELPRIGDPIVSQQWVPAGIEQFAGSMLTVGDFYYKPSSVFQEQVPGRVLVLSQFNDTKVLMQDAAGSIALELLEHKDHWWVFALPARKDGFRLLSLGGAGAKGPIALGSYGSLSLPTADSTGLFEQEGASDYLAIEEMHFKTADQLCFLFVNDRPYLASNRGNFAWASLNWGKTIDLRFEFTTDGALRQQSFKMRRSGVYEQIQVKPKYLVVGTRKLSGEIMPAEVGVKVLGNPVKVLQRTPLKEFPQLWGVVVNDPLLKSTSWPMIKAGLKKWFKQNVGSDDLVYVVHNSDRPQMILAPTTHKLMVDAALDALSPRTTNENYFTVQYLIDALTHLPQHQSRPHHVLLLTNGLTDEVKQMEDLIPKLRGTGLQLYNLEFPFEFETEIDPMDARADRLALETMAAREDKHRRHREGLRDHFLDDGDGVVVGSITFGRKKTAQKQRESRIRQRAFVEAFNKQLATLTAGLSPEADVSPSEKSIDALFTALSAWQQSLVHLQLSVPYLDSDMVKLVVPEGYSASWTLVAYGQPKK